MLSPERYLEIERGNDFRSEYFNGQMYAMPRSTPAHSIIVANTGAELHQAIKNKPFLAAMLTLRVCASRTGLYAYPDVVVICEPLQFADTDRDTVTNPKLIVEVLSETSEAYDRGRKFAQYRQIESLDEYVLVSQYDWRVETFLRQPHGEWLLTEYSCPDASVVLRSLECAIPLAEIYDKVTVAAEAEA